MAPLRQIFVLTSMRRLFLKAQGWEAGRFLCGIPRYRHPPFWLIMPEVALDSVKQKRNDALKEYDHAQLRAPII